MLNFSKANGNAVTTDDLVPFPVPPWKGGVSIQAMMAGARTI